MGPVGLPRDEVSTHGDDGSLRLLAAPAVLVVVVLLLLVTACSAAGGEESGSSGDGGDAAAVAASGDGGGDDDAEGDHGAAGAGGQVQPAEVTEDGRMLQPNGHQGIWFETAPGDPLGKLVYESQRFVGDPVELELLGDRALMPEWADMPDLCTGEVLDRLKELGIMEAAPSVPGLGIVPCGGIGNVDPFNPERRVAVDWGTMNDLSGFEDGKMVDTDGEDELVNIYTEVLGCTSFMPSSGQDLYIYSSLNNISGGHGCGRSSLFLQVVLNAIGEALD